MAKHPDVLILGGGIIGLTSAYFLAKAGLSVRVIERGELSVDRVEVEDIFRRTRLLEMIAIAEESNNLEKVLIDISDGLEKRTARNLDLMVKLLEPLMLLVMGFAVLVVVLALLLPIFNMGSQFGGDGAPPE